MHGLTHLRPAASWTGTVRHLLPRRTQRRGHLNKGSRLRRTAGAVHCSGSLDELLNEILEKHRRLQEEVAQDEEEEREDRKHLRRKYDYADRQDLWPDAEDDSGYARLPPVNIGPDPDKGPLEGQISTGYQEGMMTDEVNVEHMQYWFTRPPGGWKTKHRLVKKPEMLPGFFATAQNRGRNRPSISELQVGMKFRGTVTEVWYHHGIKVDIGYDYDGLLPMEKEMWSTFQDLLDVGDKVEVSIAKLWKHDLYRWPVHLRATDPEIQKFMIPVNQWDPPVDMRGKSVEEIERYTNRRLPTETWIVPDDPEREANPGYYKEEEDERAFARGLGGRTWEEVEEEFFDDMYDAALNLRTYDF